MDSSEAGFDAQRTMNMSRNQLEMQVRDIFISSKLPPELSELYNIPGEYVAMNSEILSAMRAGNIEFLEKMKIWETPMGCFKNEKGDSILHIVAATGHHELVSSIVYECPSLLLEPNWNNQIPLHVAAREGHSEIVKTLVACVTFLSARLVEENRERPNPYVLRDKNGDTPLHLALKEQRYEYQPLLSRLSFAKPISFSAASKPLIETAASLVNADDRASFLANKDGVSPLYLAVEAGKISLVNAMLSPANNVHNKTSESSASQSLQLEGKKLLVHAALKSKNIDVLDVILKKYPTLANERDEEGRTCLSVAASVGFKKGLCMLLDTTSSSIFDCNNDGSYPIHMAVEKGHKNVFKELLKRYPNSVEQLNKKGQNIFHIVATSGTYKLLRQLLGENRFNCLMEEQDVDGNTPVHLAIINWRPRTLSMFLDCPTKIKILSIQNTNGLRPLDIAQNNLHPEYVFRERMTLMVLLRACQLRGISWLPTSGLTLRSRSEKATGGGKYKDLIQVLLVVAALVSTMTFAAGFTIPGGFNSDGKHSGMAILVKDQNLKMFLIYDAIALYSSIGTIVALIWAQLGDQELAYRAFHLALPSLFVALLSMFSAFSYGVDATIKTNTELKSTLRYMTDIFWSAIFFVLTPLLIPQLSGIPILKAATFGYLKMLLLLVNEDDDEKNYSSGNGHTCMSMVISPGSSNENQVET